jgi:aldehyde:ferredoxin oxidoreductase
MAVMNGYAGKLLWVDLTSGNTSAQELDPAIARKYIGGMSLGAKLLWDNVPKGTRWDDPANHMFFMSGPLGGTRVMGSGTYCVVTKGAMNEASATGQANGYLGAYMKFNGFDGIAVKGKAKELSYLYIHDGVAEIRPCPHLKGMMIWEMEDAIKKELGYEGFGMSVHGIGPAGEKGVRFSIIMGDRCHTAAHGGVGTVMGSKNLKAIAIARGKSQIAVTDPEKIAALRQEILAKSKAGPMFKDGTLWIMGKNGPICRAPFKNESIDVYPMTPEQLNTFSPAYLESKMKFKPHPCWACQMNHAQVVTIVDGPLAGKEGKIPEYETFSGLGTNLGIYDGLPMVGLGNEVDRLGMDINETGWVLGWLMECYEKKLLTKEQLDGLEMTWGNLEAARKMIYKIANREGCGDWLAEGVTRASKKIGGEAALCAVGIESGATPRGHDHRRVWGYIIDNSVSMSSSSEAQPADDAVSIGLPVYDPFDPVQVATFIAKDKAHSVFNDSLGVCKFDNGHDPAEMLGNLKAVTGWNDFTWEEGFKIGRRASTLLRAFNMRDGWDIAKDAPLPRYAGYVSEGIGKGRQALKEFPVMRDTLYREMGWDIKTGKPTPETLKKLDLEFAVKDLWPAAK